METAAGDNENGVQDDQHRPDHHDVLDAELGRIHPAPDESVQAANQSENALESTFILEEFYQHHDKADDTPQQTQ
jgi:hypothetical protein